LLAKLWIGAVEYAWKALTLGRLRGGLDLLAKKFAWRAHDAGDANCEA
jgi:hypothetical protein